VGEFKKAVHNPLVNSKDHNLYVYTFAFT
jgi:hypothetical protein